MLQEVIVSKQRRHNWYVWVSMSITPLLLNWSHWSTSVFLSFKVRLNPMLLCLLSQLLKKWVLLILVHSYRQLIQYRWALLKRFQGLSCYELKLRSLAINIFILLVKIGRFLSLDSLEHLLLLLGTLQNLLLSLIKISEPLLQWSQEFVIVLSIGLIQAIIWNIHII